MKKHYRLGAKPHRFRSRLWLIVPIIGMGGGLYLLLLAMAPKVHNPPAPQSDWNEPVVKTELHEQRLYIPRLSLNLAYKSGDQHVLRDALWHRFPERGDPEKGGNFILAGHRFEVGLTPNETKRRSPFYHINKIQVGDYIYADWNGRRYQYEITRKYTVKPNQTEIEAPSGVAKMTIYTCTLAGQADGREVLEATLVKKDVDPSTDLTLSSKPQP